MRPGVHQRTRRCASWPIQTYLPVLMDFPPDQAHEKPSRKALIARRRSPPRARPKSSCRRRSSALGALLGAIFLSIVASAPASTQTIVVEIDRGAFAAPSSYFQARATPGAHLPVGAIELLNRTGRPVAVGLDPVDGKTADRLGWIFGAAGGPIDGSTRWLGLSSPRVDVPAHGTRLVAVTVAARPSARAGDYLSGIVLHSADTSGAVAMNRRVLPVEMLVPGPRHAHLTLVGARVERSRSSIQLSLLARNDGNVILKAVHGRVSVTQGTRVVASAAIGPGTFVAHTSVEIPIAAHRLPAPGEGPYRVRARLLYKHRLATLDSPLDVPANLAGGRVGATRARPRSGRPARPRMAGVPGVAWALLGALLTGLAAIAVYRRRRHILLPRRATLALLERTLARLEPRERPLSVIHVAVSAPSKAANRRLAVLLRRELRKGDVVGDLWTHGLLVILPNTGRGPAEQLGVKLGRLVSGAGADHLAGQLETETAASTPELHLLLQWLRSRGLGVLGRGRELPEMEHASAPASDGHERAGSAGAARSSVPLRELLGSPQPDVRPEVTEELVREALIGDADLEFTAKIYANSEDGRRQLGEDLAAIGDERSGVIVVGTLVPSSSRSREIARDR
jgi:hypothetical protein